ncbi:MAG: hypothetical protein ACKVS5_13110 [Parvularculaceae bacterium]
MSTWINKTVERASWLHFALWFAAWWAVSWFFFYRDSAWTRSLSAGGGKLPESQAGFPPIEPQRSFDALNAAGATPDYILWQALDIPFALISAISQISIMALALRATRQGAGPLRFLLLVPPLYVAAELVENALVAAFAAEVIAPAEGVVLVQQLATTIKLGAGWGSVGIALVALAVALIAGLVGLVKKRG